MPAHCGSGSAASVGLIEVVAGVVIETANGLLALTFPPRRSPGEDPNRPDYCAGANVSAKKP